MEGRGAAEAFRGLLPHLRGRSALYERIVAGLAGAAERGFDGGLLARLLATPELAGPAEARLLVLALLHDAALRDPALPHAAWYPYAVGADARPPEQGAPAALALAWLVEHEDEAAEFLATRRMQTNEVNRCVALLPGVLQAGQFGQPLRLLELGASAGLNLHLDHHRHVYDGGPTWGPSGGPTLHTRAEGRVPRTLTPPTLEVVERRGVDLAPLDVRDDADVRRLHAFVWAEAERHARLDAAVAVARAEPVTIDRGDLVEWAATHGAPVEGATTVLFHSQVRHLLSRERDAALGEVVEGLLRRATASAPVVHVAFESPRGVPDDGSNWPEVVVGIGDGSGPPTWRTLVSADWHGRWVRWF